MTMAEIEQRLPNGFHDAELLAINVDYVSRQARLDFKLWVDVEEIREEYASATLFLDDFQYVVVEPPRPDNWQHDQSSVDGFATSAHSGIAIGLPRPAVGKFAHSLFVVNWNASIHIAASSARLAPSELLDLLDNNDEV